LEVASDHALGMKLVVNDVGKSTPDVLGFTSEPKALRVR
jgi:hypothetical protein